MVCIFQISDDTSTADLLVFPHPRLIINGDIQSGAYTICCEGHILCNCASLIEGFKILISFYYTLNIEYPECTLNTLKFIQNSFLKIKKGSIPQRVRTLMGKIL